MKTVYLLLISVALSACGTMESIVKSSFPYTTTLMIAKTSQPGKEYSAVNEAQSLDQSFRKNGNNADKIDAVHIISAQLRAAGSNADYNIGQLSSVQVYMSKADGKDEVMVASQKNISPTAGNSMTLDIDNSHFLDELVRQPSVNVRMKYKLRDKVSKDINLKVILNVTGYPKGNFLAWQ